LQGIAVGTITIIIIIIIISNPICTWYSSFSWWVSCVKYLKISDQLCFSSLPWAAGLWLSHHGIWSSPLTMLLTMERAHHGYIYIYIYIYVCVLLYVFII
jgi:hypothetical protein